MQHGPFDSARIAAPSAFLWGAHDPVLRYDFSDKLGDYFAEFTLERADEAGHFVHFEVPKLANARLLDFLSKVPN
jgi:pimeloyl-ACP methyl ester carboxylesterase